MKQFSALLFVVLCFGGCGQSQPVSQQPVTQKSTAAKAKPQERVTSEKPRPRRATDAVRDDYEQSRTEYEQREREVARLRAETAEDVMILQLGEMLRDSMSQGDAIVVWLLDCTANNDQLRANTTRAITNLYADLTVTAVKHPEAGTLATSLVAIGHKNSVVIDEPTKDYDTVTEKLSRLSKTNAEQEPIFASVSQAIDRYGSYRKQGSEVYLVLVTNEAGDDPELGDAVISKAKRLAIPVYVVGAPAMFGRRYAPGNAKDKAVHGPESLELERIQLDFFDGDQTNDMIDSGFGPFALERLCRATGGTYLTIRPGQAGQDLSLRMRSSEWPDPLGPKFDRNTMRSYRPQYVTRELYQQGLASNPARQALHDAAKLPAIQFTRSLTVNFEPRNQADLVNKVNEAQKDAARLTRPLATLHETLRVGMAGRESLSAPRWRAGYDLALGRATAARTRIQGYNEMLAALKRDGSFKQEGSTTWYLEPADTSEMSSNVDKLAKTAKEILQGVVTEHAGTPWAFIAQQELRTPLGWKWVEQ